MSHPSIASPETPTASRLTPMVRSRRRRRPLVGTVALLPFVVFTLALTVYPFARIVQMAFSETKLQEGGFDSTWVGLANFADVLSGPEAWQALGNTVLFIVVTVAGSILIGTAAALVVNRAVWTLPLARNVLIWPAVIAPVVISLMWLLILSPTVGGLNKLLETVGLPAQSWLNTEAGAMASLMFVDVWHWMPVVFLFTYTALQSISAEILEAARIDGAGELAIVRRVILPLLAPAIGVVAVVRVVMGVKVFDEMYLLTAGGPNGATTLVSQRIQLWFFSDLKFGAASSFSLIVILGTILVLAVFLVARHILRSRQS